MTQGRKLLRHQTVVALLALCVISPTAAINGQGPAQVRERPSFDVTERSIEELQNALTAGVVTSQQLVRAYFDRIEAYDRRGPLLNAIVTLNPRASDAAAALDAERAARGSRGPLHGIPILVKDNYETEEMATSAGSIALAGFHPVRDAVLVQRLKAAGAIILGKTNMQELASGIVNVGSRFGQTLNPYDLDRNPGGSSGGTGAAIAASFAAAGMGSDTCGSIRNPASHNNLVGLRGTQGLSSRTGIVPLSSTQDIGGPITRTVPDLAIMLDATVGPDPKDPSTAESAGHIPASYRASLSDRTLQGVRIGVLRSLFGTAVDDEEVSTVVVHALDELKQAGAEVEDVAIPGLDDLLRDSSVINFDFKFDLANYLATWPDAPVKSLAEILDRGLFHEALEAGFRTRNAVKERDSEAARRARVKRVAIRQAVEAVLAEHRLVALVYPTLRRKPARIGEPQRGSNCQLSAHSGLPALALPAGFTPDGLPVGMDLLGSAYDEPRLLSLGYSVERVLRRREPPFSAPPMAGSPSAERTAIVAVNQMLALDFTYNPVTARVEVSWRGPSADLAGISAIWLHSGTSEKPGAARHVLYSSGQGLHRDLALGYAARQDLAAGQLLLRIFPADANQQIRDVPLPLDMQRISGNSFVMGTPAQRVDALMTRFGSKRRELFASELPAHRATTKPFLIDRTEVTNSAFKRFVDAYPQWLAGRIAADQHNGDYLKHWSDTTYPAGEGNHPVTFVTWQAAASFCKSVGKRLPTEIEWEFAAGKGDSAEFPWGDAMPDASHANWSGTKIGGPTRVGSFPPVRGLYDMAGNVWEFVEDSWTDNYEPSSKASSDRRVIRGGSFGGSAVNLRVRYRDSHPALGAGPHVGFRCARSAEEKK